MRMALSQVRSPPSDAARKGVASLQLRWIGRGVVQVEWGHLSGTLLHGRSTVGGSRRITPHIMVSWGGLADSFSGALAAGFLFAGVVQSIRSRKRWIPTLLALAFLGLGFGAGAILGVQQVSKLLPHFFSTVPITHTVPSASKILDKASFWIGMSNSVDQNGYHERFIGFGASVGIIVHLLFHHGSEPTIALRIVGKLASTTDNIQSSWLKMWMQWHHIFCGWCFLFLGLFASPTRSRCWGSEGCFCCTTRHGWGLCFLGHVVGISIGRYHGGCCCVCCSGCVRSGLFGFLALWLFYLHHYWPWHPVCVVWLIGGWYSYCRAAGQGCADTIEIYLGSPKIEE